MRGLIITSILALSGPYCFALNMTPRILQANPTAAPARLTTSTVTATRTVSQTISTKTKSVLARVTVYWAGGRGSDRYTRQHKTATGCRLKSGHCAVDPRHIPYGSQVILSDGTKLAAVDTGSAVRTRRAARTAGRTSEEKGAIVIDRFFETKRQALTWANTHPMFMPVRVVEPNSATATQAGPGKTYVVASNRPASSAGSLNKFRN
jgi:3D (Asp-Asp-Asp) domain-containing protein